LRADPFAADAVGGAGFREICRRDKGAERPPDVGRAAGAGSPSLPVDAAGHPATVECAAEIALCAVSVAVDVRAGGAFCLFSCRGHGAAAWLWIVLLLAISIPLAHFLVSNGWWDADEMPTQQEAAISGKGFEGTDEYDPAGDDHAELPSDAPPVSVWNEENALMKKSRAQVLQWTTEQKEIRVDTKSAARLAIRVLDYPAWQVQVNGVPVEPGKAEDSDQMVIEIPAGQSDVRIQFVRTRDRTVGIILSLCAAFLAIVMLVLSKLRSG
jgi:hypothetical protein